MIKADDMILKVISKDYPKWAKYYKNPEKKLAKITPSGQTEQDIIDFSICYFDQILLARVNGLFKLKSLFDNHGWTKYFKKNTTFRDEVLKAYGYEQFKKRQQGGIWLARQLGIKSCPYCNAQYTLVADGKRKFTYDHYFPKSDYPQLSLSLYNLIPVCSSCNIQKSDTIPSNRSYHPYLNSLDDISEFEVEPSSLIKFQTSSMKSEEMININWKSSISGFSDVIEEHEKTFQIVGMYQNFKDHAAELIRKAYVYNSSYQDDLLKLRGLFPDESTFKRYLLGNYPSKREILKRPLAKLYIDLGTKLGLI